MSEPLGEGETLGVGAVRHSPTRQALLCGFLYLSSCGFRLMGTQVPSDTGPRRGVSEVCLPSLISFIMYQCTEQLGGQLVPEQQ